MIRRRRGSRLWGLSLWVFLADTGSYLGPLILDTKNVPVRVKFRNLLPAGAAGDLFLPADTSIMGAGMQLDYTQNRATVHLHGAVPQCLYFGHSYFLTMGYKTKVQSIKRKSSEPFYINFPMVLAQALELGAGEEIE